MVLANQKDTRPAAIGVNAAGATGIGAPPIFDLQGFMKTLDPAINATLSRREREEGNDKIG